MFDDAHRVKKLLSKGTKFWMDTNVFVNLAEDHNGRKLLEELSNARFQLVFYKENHDELDNLVKHRVFPHPVKHALSKFLDHVFVVGDMDHARIKLVEDRLSKVEDLLPRQLAYDELLAPEGDSFANRLLGYVHRYAANPARSQSELQNIAKTMKDAKSLAKSSMMLRADELIDKLDLDEDRLRKGHYFDSVEKMTFSTIAKLKEIFEKWGLNFTPLLHEVDVMRQKNHSTDKRFVARIISEGIEGYSNDDDVVMLQLLHASMPT